MSKTKWLPYTLNLSAFRRVTRSLTRTLCHFRFWHVHLQRDDTEAVAERSVLLCWSGCCADSAKPACTQWAVTLSSSWPERRTEERIPAGDVTRAVDRERPTARSVPPADVPKLATQTSVCRLKRFKDDQRRRWNEGAAGPDAKVFGSLRTGQNDHVDVISHYSTIWACSTTLWLSNPGASSPTWMGLFLYQNKVTWELLDLFILNLNLQIC